MKLDSSYIFLDSYFTYQKLISSLLVRISSHYIILEMITNLKRFHSCLHIIVSQLFYMVPISILELLMIQVTIFLFFPRRIFLNTSTFSLEQHQQYFNIFGFLFMSFLEGGFSPCGFLSFLSSLNKINFKGWPYPCCWALYRSIFFIILHMSS